MMLPENDIRYVGNGPGGTHSGQNLFTGNNVVPAQLLHAKHLWQRRPAVL